MDPLSRLATVDFLRDVRDLKGLLQRKEELLARPQYYQLDKVYTLWYIWFRLKEFVVQNTNPKQFRAELKDYLDLAAKEPIRIQRRSGDSFILLKEDVYQELQAEIVSLQRRLLGLSQVVDGRTTEYKPGDRSRLARLRTKK
ncbi:MAG: hypothetical protein C5B49_03930 [Bdellovibrio sp.]|nr:MAG: hypothetical protein C5B49_03930 [Bdellovibrio sp.]